jgi:hypothetical protein
VFEPGDLVTGWGRVLSDGDGVWLDLSRVVTLALDPGPPRRGRSSVRLFDADLSLVPTEFGPANAIPGTATVTGWWLGDAIAVTAISPAGPVNPPQPSWQTPPCPPPPGGWPHGMNGSDYADNLTFDEGDLQRSGAAVTLVTFQPGPDQAVLVVAARDPDAVRAWLGPQLPGRLCIVPARWTRRQLDDVRDHAKQRRQKWGVELMTERIDDNAQAQIVIAVMRVTADLSAWAATVPDGLLAVEPSLAPAT